MTEADFQRAVLDLARTLGLAVFHSGDSRRDACAGFPDLVIVGKRGVLWRELKTQKGRVRPEQLDWLRRLNAAAQDAAIWRPSDLKSHLIQTQLRSIA